MSTITKSHPEFYMTQAERMAARRERQRARVPGVLKANALIAGVSFDTETGRPLVKMISDELLRGKSRSKYTPHQGKRERQRRRSQ